MVIPFYATHTQAAGALRAAGYPAVAELVGGREYDLAGSHAGPAEMDAVEAAVRADGLEPAWITHYHGGGNTTESDGRTVVVRFTFGWDAAMFKRHVCCACLPEPEPDDL